MQKDDIIAKANSFIGTKFRFKGKTRNGLDCLGLIYLIIYELEPKSYFLEYFDEYGNNFEYIAKKLQKLKLGFKSNFSASDVLVFNINNTTCHFGIYVGDGFFVHAYISTRSVVKVELNDYWKSKIHTVIKIADYE